MMKFFNKYFWLIVLYSCLIVIFWLIAINRNVYVTNDDCKLEVIDNEIRIKETGEVLYRFIPVDGGKMSFEYVDTLFYDNQMQLSHYHSIKEIPSFLIGETPVTFRLWNYVMNDITELSENDIQNYFLFYKDSVSAVGWDKFIKKLNYLTGREFSLPSSFQWEFAARGGLKGNNYFYSGSDNIDDVALYNGNSLPRLKTRTGKVKKSNELGIYDMSGSVWELTTTSIPEIYPSFKMFQPNSYPMRLGICRGGNWNSSPRECSVKYMSRMIYLFSGARLVLLADNEAPPASIVTHPELPIDYSLVGEEEDVLLSVEVSAQHFNW
jgi:hypothetical protein